MTMACLPEGNVNWPKGGVTPADLPFTQTSPQGLMASLTVPDGKGSGAGVGVSLSVGCKDKAVLAGCDAAAAATGAEPTGAGLARSGGATTGMAATAALAGCAALTGRADVDAGVGAGADTTLDCHTTPVSYTHLTLPTKRIV